MTTLVRWDPFREVASLHTELSRLMNGLSESGPRQAQAWVPTVDVWETEDAVVYAFDLPGVPQDKIEVAVEDGALTVNATREREETVDEERYHRVERRYGSFTRTVSLPQGVAEEQIAATYADGVLKITVPKPEQAKPKRIEISVGGDEPKTIEGTVQS